MEKERLKFLGIYLENALGDKVDLVALLIQGGFSLSEIQELGFDYWEIIKCVNELYENGEFNEPHTNEEYLELLRYWGKIKWPMLIKCFIL